VSAQSDKKNDSTGDHSLDGEAALNDTEREDLGGRVRLQTRTKGALERLLQAHEVEARLVTHPASDLEQVLGSVVDGVCGSHVRQQR
jgi:hypothetical protein